MKTLDELVYGHTQAKKVLSILLKRSRERYYKQSVQGETEGLQEPLRCLLIGSSGTGKTHLIYSFKKVHDFPLLTLDATQLMPTGNDTGVNLKQLQKKIDAIVKECLERKDGRYPSREGVLNQLVVFVDEIDKLGTSFDSSGNWNKHVQSSFLTMIDNKEEYAGVSWIFAGAFSALREKASAKVGFSHHPESEKIEISDDDILKAGIIPEMLGRISLIVELDMFTESDYKRICIERLLPAYPHLSLEYKEIDAIVRKAHGSGQGIRSLTRQLEMLSIDAELDQSPHFISEVLR